MNPDRFDALQVGDEAELLHVITPGDLEAFVRLTGDANPLHVDERFAGKTTLGKPVVHGMLTASFISTMIGTKLPGEGAFWFEQQLRFLAPVRVGEEIRVWAKVKAKSPALRVVVLETHVYAKDGRKVIEGEAKVKMMKPDPEESSRPGRPTEARGGMVVTGGGRGIGAAIARQLAADGYGVVVNYLRDAASADAVVRGIVEGGGRAVAVRADVRVRAEVDLMVEEGGRAFGSIEGVVNNAGGVIVRKGAEEVLWEDVLAQLEVQVRGALNVFHAALPWFLRQGGGAVVDVASIYADNVPPERMLAYNVAKSGLVALSRSLAAEFGPKGIRVNVVSPGMTQTDLIADVPEKAKALAKVHAPLRRLASPEDVAGAVSFLMSAKARHVTGETIRVCGGLVMA